MKKIDLSKRNVGAIKIAKNISIEDFDTMNNFVNSVDDFKDEDISNFIKEL